MSALQTLLDMGFSETSSKRALLVCKNDVGASVDWIMNNADSAAAEQPLTAEEEAQLLANGEKKEEGAVLGTKSDVAVEEQIPSAQSLKCDDCGKILRDEMAAQVHAERTQHSNFSESTEAIKPLTEEEKAAQLARLQEKMQAKKAARQEEEKKQAIERERLRREQGRQATTSKEYYRQESARRAARELAQQRKEDKIARQRVREAIAKDRAERGFTSSAASSQATLTPTSTQANEPPADDSAKSNPVQPKTYTECRLQLRLPNGTSSTHTYSVDAPLSEVLATAQSQASAAVKLLTPFPRRVFGPDDMERSLTDLRLVPSAVLVVTVDKSAAQM